MCRLFIYFGDSINFKEILFSQKHSIIKQSYMKTYTPFLNIPNIRDHEFNVDGFGIAWYFDNSKNPCLYTSTKPPWNDINIKRLSKYLSSKLIFGHVRAIKPFSKSLVHEYNCHPFQYKNFLFMHNGDIKNFDFYRKNVIGILKNDVYKIIKGNTDSEYAFALFLNILDDKIFKNGGYIKDIGVFRNLINNLINSLLKICNDTCMSLNFGITDGNTIICTRFLNCKDEEPPSIHYKTYNNNIMISSEPIDYDDDWTVLGKNKMLIYSNNKIIIYNL